MKKPDLQHSTFDHNLHTVHWDSSYLIDSIFEDGRRKIGIELDIVCLSCMLDVDGNGSHGGG
jgi:hypothetical protein